MTLRITKFSHNFSVDNVDPRYRTYIEDFARNFLLQINYFKSWNGTVNQSPGKLFAVRSHDKTQYRFHINHFTLFYDYMSSRGVRDFDIKEEPMYEPVTCEFKIVTDKKPRDTQPEIIHYLVSDGKKKVIELQTGMGKTLCAMFAVAQIGQRTLLSIKPMYIQRWKDDLCRKTGIFNLSPRELTVIQGSQALATVIRMALDGELEYKFIIISNKTLSIYYKDYLTGVDMEKYHNVLPQDLMKTLGIGVRVIDEAHQDFHQCFKTDLFSHVPKTIELSATLAPDNKFLKEMYLTVYPMEARFGGGTYKKYIDVISVPFRLDHDNKARVKLTNYGRMEYSHGSLEESIMNSKKRIKNFLDMVTELTQRYFIEKRHSNYKLLIFASRVEMCKTIADHLQKIYPQLKITKYTQEEDYTILADMDIIVSTPISSGTAVDIPRLQVCINTVAVGASQLNLQMIGRLRQLHDAPNINPLFIYTYCVDIEKHVEYHVKKRDHTFAGKTLSYIDLMPIGFTV